VLVSASVNGAHSQKERVACWLLMMRDSSDDGRTADHSRIPDAEMLVCRGQAVTKIAGELERLF